MNAKATGRHEIRDGHDVIALTRTFRAPIVDVWAAVTEPDRMARWIGSWSGDPASGAVLFRMTSESEDAAAQEWQIRACEPPNRLVVHTGDQSGAWHLALYLSEYDGVTTLKFTQVIDDPAALESVGPGWEYYLDRLVAAETHGDVSGVDFDRDYYPALSGHYAGLRPAE